jgi:hypothetical protein
MAFADRIHPDVDPSRNYEPLTRLQLGGVLILKL